MDKIIVNKLDEIIYHETLENGLEVYIYKKEGFNKKTAYFTTKYGSNNFEFAPIGNDKLKKYPKGIAHFLEHKLFESTDDEHTFKKFEKYGAMVNAYTNHVETAYYFSTTYNFEECLELLLDFVQYPHFTEENVEKEKGIINQEIDMTNDRIPYVIFMKTLENVLYNNPNKNPTIGDKENVNKITKEDLYECYNTFYHPSNMILTISGDIEPKEVLKQIKCNQARKKYIKQEEIKMPIYEEKKEVVKKYEHIKLNVVTPRVSVCYKMLVPNLDRKQRVKLENFINMFMDLKFGTTSDFKRKLIEDKIIKSEFEFEIERYDDVLLFIFVADAVDKDMFVECLDKKLKEISFDEKIFNLNKKVYLASMVRAFENPSYIAGRIYREIVRDKAFSYDAYDLQQELTFESFLKNVSKLNFENKSVLYITGFEEGKSVKSREYN